MHDVRAAFVPNQLEIEQEALGRGLKRGFDIVVASLILVVLAPFFVMLTILIKMTNHGPIIYQHSLPPYAPELNSTENIWEYLRRNFLSHCVWDNYEAILDACCDAWNALMAKSEVITSIGTRDWAQVRI